MTRGTNNQTARAVRVVAVIMLGSVISQPVTMLAGQSAPPSQTQTQPTEQPKSSSATTVPGAVVPPPGYVIGPEDVLTILFWREKDLSSDVIVRPDGMISLPLLNDIHAAGLTTDQLREKVMAEANKFVEDPNATVVVKQINSRKVYITGQVAKPGSYPLAGPMSVLQLIAMAGGLLEYADKSRISIMRTDEKGNPVAYPFNYEWVLNRKNLRQNIELKPGDTILVP
jgi:polysaccharide export outer membrane protein